MSTVSVTNLKHESASGNNITLDSNGRVGVGTAPGVAVDVRTADAASVRLSRSGTAGQIASLVFEDGNAALGSGSTTRIASGSGYLAFSTGGTSGNTTGGTERMRIDSAGRVTMPYQPYGAASISAATPAAGVRGFYPGYSVSRGGLTVNDANGRFTVPVAGAYLIGHTNLNNSGTGNCHCQIRVNGTVVTGGNTQDTNGVNDNFSQQTIVELSANDYVDFNVVSGAFHNNQNYSRFYICLLG